MYGLTINIHFFFIKYETFNSYVIHNPTKVSFNPHTLHFRLHKQNTPLDHHYQEDFRQNYNQSFKQTIDFDTSIGS